MTAPSHVVLHGHDVAYRLAGEGEAILLIHGMAGSSDTWRHVMPTLAKHHLVLAPDLPGHGSSDKPAAGDYSLGAYANGLRDLLTALDIPRATIVGQSLGGGVAMQLAYQHPELCERLVLMSSGGLGREVSLLLRLLSAPGAELVLKIAVPSFVRERGDATRRWLGAHGLKAHRIDEMWRAYSSLGDPDTRQAFLRTLRSVVDPGGQTVSAHDRLYLAEEMPTLIIWGDADPIIPVSHAHAAHEAMPASRIEILHGVGHFPQVEAPREVTDTLLDFMATTRPARIEPATFRDRLRLTS